MGEFNGIENIESKVQNDVNVCMSAIIKVVNSVIETVSSSIIESIAINGQKLESTLLESVINLLENMASMRASSNSMPPPPKKSHKSERMKEDAYAAKVKEEHDGVDGEMENGMDEENGLPPLDPRKSSKAGQEYDLDFDGGDNLLKALEGHYNVITERKNASRRHPCTQCSYISDRQSGLEKHIRAVHEKRRDFQCDYCEYAATQRSNLNNHIKKEH